MNDTLYLSQEELQNIDNGSLASYMVFINAYGTHKILRADDYVTVGKDEDAFDLINLWEIFTDMESRHWGYIVFDVANNCRVCVKDWGVSCES